MARFRMMFDQLYSPYNKFSQSEYYDELKLARVKTLQWFYEERFFITPAQLESATKPVESATPKTSSPSPPILDRITASAMLRRISFKNFPYPIKLMMANNLIVVSVTVPERDHGRPIVVFTHVTLPLDNPAYKGTEKQFLTLVKSAVKSALCHEVDEAFHFDGERDDPHKDGRPARVQLNSFE